MVYEGLNSKSDNQWLIRKEKKNVLIQYFYIPDISKEPSLV